ncbi:MAG: putative porin [Gammaproteobacteria bacterium]
MKHLFLFLISFCLLAPANAAIQIDNAGTFFVYGDARLRLERDWDSYRTDGTKRSDRDRARIRARLGVLWRPADFLEFNIRARTGNDDHQQSGHVTIIDFNGNDRGASDINLDKWYAQLNWGPVSVWGGRNSKPWWKQNSLFWDDDATPRGVGLIYSTALGDGKLTYNAGVYDMPAGMQNYTGDAWSSQLVYERDSGRLGFTLSTGLVKIEADAKEGDYASRTLLQGNAFRDYKVWVTSVQLRPDWFTEKFHLGADYIHNAESYSADDPDPFTAFNKDNTDGYILQAVYGNTKERGDWLAGVYYSHLELLALNNSYAQDDWLRWGSSDQTASSNFKGPELRFGLGLGNNANAIFRLFIVRAINKELPDDERKQTGKRIRLDLNWKF